MVTPASLRRAQVSHGRCHVETDVGVGRLLEVRLMVEVAAAAPGPCRPAVVVEGQRMHSRIAEPKRQLLIERMQPSDVGQDHHA